MSLLARAFTPRPRVSPELLSPQEQRYYNGLSGLAQEKFGHPFQDAGAYEADSGWATARDATTMTVEVWALARSGRQMATPNFSVPRFETQWGARLEPGATRWMQDVSPKVILSGNGQTWTSGSGGQQGYYDNFNVVGGIPKIHGNSQNATGPHDVYVIRDAATQRIYHFGETGRGVEVRGNEWIRKLRNEHGLNTVVEPLRTVEGKAAAKALQTRYIDTYEKVFGIRITNPVWAD